MDKYSRCGPVRIRCSGHVFASGYTVWGGRPHRGSCCSCCLCLHHTPLHNSEARFIKQHALFRRRQRGKAGFEDVDEECCSQQPGGTGQPSLQEDHGAVDGGSKPPHGGLRGKVSVDAWQGQRNVLPATLGGGTCSRLGSSREPAIGWTRLAIHRSHRGSLHAHHLPLCQHLSLFDSRGGVARVL